MELSIIIPVYNSEKYLKRCLDSIINQTLKDIEIIAVNDGSTDKSLKILEEYEKKYKNIKIINKKNSGPANTRNIGIEKATGEYIGFVDSDDYINEDMYKNLYNESKKHNAEIIMCNYREVFEDGSEEKIIKAGIESDRVFNEKDILENIISTFSKEENRGFYTLCNKIYKKKFIEDNGLKIDERREHGEDWLFNIKAFKCAKSYIFIDKPYYNYIHSNKNSLMFKYRENQFELFKDGREQILELVPEEYIDKEALNRKYIYEFSSYIIGTFINVKDKEKQKKLIYKVFESKDVKEALEYRGNIGIHYKIGGIFIKKNFFKLGFFWYKMLYLIKHRSRDNGV